jgi:flagellar biosynthesis protein FliQ
MKLFQSTVSRLAAFAAVPFVALALTAFLSPAPVLAETPDITSWYNPFSYGAEGRATEILQSQYRANLAWHNTATTWAFGLGLAVAVVAAVTKVQEHKRVKDPLIMEAAMSAVSLYAKGKGETSDAPTQEAPAKEPVAAN